MKKSIVGYGAGGHAGVIIDIIEDNNEYKIEGLVDKIKAKKKYGYKIIGDDLKLEQIYKKNKNIFFGIAGIKSIKKNILLYNKLEKIGFNIVSIIHQKSIISKNVKIGKSIKIFSGVKINSNVILGKNVFLNTGAIIEHDCKIGDHSQVGPGAMLSGGVQIKKGCFIGIGSKINQNITVGENSVIGSGSVVVKNVKKNSIYAGVPAKQIGVLK
tara:strand:- start:32 stop:670 length:639 start_codon:yes stop_codon:yes gene_type:complete